MQADTPSYPPQIAHLFAPKQPVKYIEPVDYPVEQRRLPTVTPVGSFLDVVRQYNSEHQYESTEGLQQKDQRLRKEKVQKAQEKLAADLRAWDPLKDPHVASSDPYKTIFVARLSYKVTEVELQQFFSKFGTVKRLRLVRDKATERSKGYAFVEFETEQMARACFKEANGDKLMDRSILVDFERSRSTKNWLPRRLGGGLGGRHYTRVEQERAAARERREQQRNVRSGRPPSGPKDRFSHGRGHERTPYDRNGPRYGRADGGGRAPYRAGGGAYRDRNRY